MRDDAVTPRPLSPPGRRPLAATPLLAILVTFALGIAGPRSPAETIVRESVSASVLTNYALPAHLLQRFQDRRLIDSFQNQEYRVAPSIGPRPSKEFTARGRSGQFVRVLKSNRDAVVEQLRASCPSNAVPPRGFLAPILSRQETAGSNLWWTLPAPSGVDAEAAQWIERRLASDGLLPTLVHVLKILGPSPPALERLRVLGFPTDLLRHFRWQADDKATAARTEAELIRTVSQRLADGAPVADLIAALDQAEFDFQPTAPEFTVASECGRHEVGLLRLQAGGGWSDGLIPGDVLDVLYQLVETFPNAEFLISVPQIAADGVEWMAKTLWRLRRIHQVTLCVEPYRVSSWAQDNGKGGLLRRPKDGATNAVPATLAPRYACIDEGASQFMPAESFLMDGLAAAGHPVLHSSLLFQGGNVMPVHDPGSPRPLLLVGEGEIHRNVALGLTRTQAVEAFRREFGASRCEVLPSVSYHLDYDVTFRTDGERPLAFVNDHAAAVRLILGLGLNALAKAPGIDTNALGLAQKCLATEDASGLSRALSQLLSRLPRGSDGIREEISRCFVVDTTDSAARNLQTFLVAADLLEVSLATPSTNAVDSPRAKYLQALHRVEAARATQAERLRELGFQLVPIPSLTELHYAINYLNGIQHAGGYVMPVFGGFYTPLDRAAIEAYRKALGPQRRIQVIRSAESQRKFGAVHCTSSAYPRP